MTGLPPIPTESILKRDHSTNVESLARILSERDYATTFVYGGRGVFDGMRSFMLANGFQRFVEQADFENPGFTNAWGVDDEAIFDKALRECDDRHADGRPFFTTILTVSNHRPYTYPDGHIDRASSDQKRDNAVKYAAYAVGRFFEKLKQKPYFNDTMVVVLGDHGARVYGAQQFPIESYRVPVWLFLPNREQAGERNSIMSCALDIAPTLLGQLGGTYRTTMFGRDATSVSPTEGRALMQHNHELALLRHDGRMTVLSLAEAPATYTVDEVTRETESAPIDPADEHTATAIFQLANRLYYDDDYRHGVDVP